ncbi:MAG: hypothetical protein HY059_13735 [Proteobacteria bacterium]|nr:hypothetical protein [Pseudomonadota bacterium]
MRTLFRALLFLAIASPAFAFAPGDQVVVRFKDGSLVSGVLSSITSQVTLQIGGISASWPWDQVAGIDAKAVPAPVPPAAPKSQTPDLSQQGLLQPPPPPLGYRPHRQPIVIVQPVAHRQRAYTKEEQDAFLKMQADQREALRHRPSRPEEDYQLQLQQGIDRVNRGLPFRP